MIHETAARIWAAVFVDSRYNRGMDEPENPFQAPQSDAELPPESGTIRRLIGSLVGTILVLYGTLGILGNLSLLFSAGVPASSSYVVGLFLLPVLAFVTGLLMLRRIFRRRYD
jgi:hypothetical protein